jgi:hypothetical protein
MQKYATLFVNCGATAYGNENVKRISRYLEKAGIQHLSAKQTCFKQ